MSDMIEQFYESRRALMQRPQRRGYVSGLNPSPSFAGDDGATGPAGLTGAPGLDGEDGEAGATGPTGPTGAPGATGMAGPTGLAGPTGNPGPTGAMGPTGMRGPTGDMGATGMRGPTGPAGPTGAPSMVEGPPGPTGPKGSFVKTALGIYEFACIEGTRSWFADIVPADAPLRKKFAAAVDPASAVRFASVGGNYELVLAVRREFPDFDMPPASEQQRQHSVRFWNQEYLTPRPS